MADERLDILIELTDNLSGRMKKVEDGLTRFKRTTDSNNTSMEEFGKSLQRTGSQMQRLGANMTFLGAAITGPLILAFKNSREHSALVRNELYNLSAITTVFQRNIAEAMIPTVQRFTLALENLNYKWDSLNPKMQQGIINTTLVGGGFLILSGIIFNITGKIEKMGGALLTAIAVHPEVALLLASIGAMAVALRLIGDEGDSTTVKMGLLFDKIMQGALNAMFPVAMLGERLKDLQLNKKIAVAVEGGAEGEGPFAGFSDKITAELEKGYAAYSAFIDRIMKKDKDSSENQRKSAKQISDEKIKQQATEYQQQLVLAQSFYSFLSQTTEMAYAENKRLGWILKGVRIGEAVINTATGVTRAFAEWPFPFSVAVGGIIAALGAAQIAIIAGQKMHSGGMVGNDGLASDERQIVAQTGEGILSRRGMAALGGEGSLNRLNAGEGSPNNITVHIQNASFRSEEDIEDVFQRLSFLLQAKQRSRI